MTSKKGLFCLTLLVVPSLLIGEGSTEERLAALEKDYRTMEIVKPQLGKTESFFIGADYLYWRASSYALSYAALYQPPNVPEYIFENLHFKANSGFRIALGYRMPHDSWEIFLAWTWFLSKAQASSFPSSAGNTIYPEWASFLNSNTGTTSCNAKWKVQFNILDGELSRYFKVTDFVAFIPHFGLRGLWFHQKYDTTTLNSPTVTNDSLHFKNNFAGAGLVCGLGGEWELWRSFSFITDVGGSLLYGSFNLQRSDTQSTPPSPSFYSNTTNKTNQIAPTADISLALAYDKTFCGDAVAFRLSVGWEFNDFFWQNKLRHVLYAEHSSYAFVSNNEDVTTQGLVVSGRIDF